MTFASASARAQTPGMTPLFDGTDLNGWAQKPAGTFTVNAADGAIETTGNSRGVLYTTQNYISYRVMYTVRQVTWLHWPAVLFFGTDIKADAMNGVQFQLPENFGWDYRKGKNGNIARDLLTKFGKLPNLQKTGVWYRCQIIVNQAAGTADASAGPEGGPLVHIMTFTDPSIVNTPCPFALQCHQKHVMDEFKDIEIEVNP